MTWAYLRDVWMNKVVVGATAEVGRVFLACRECRRVVPLWRLVGVRGDMTALGCKCGHQEVRPLTIPEWQAWAWLIYAYGWRKLLRGRANWDPRMPIRERAL